MHSLPASSVTLLVTRQKIVVIGLAFIKLPPERGLKQPLRLVANCARHFIVSEGKWELHSYPADRATIPATPHANNRCTEKSKVFQQVLGLTKGLLKAASEAPLH